MTKKILIIGGHGFLGYNLSKYLIKKKFDLEVISKKKEKKKLLKNAKYLFCNILDRKKLKRKLENKNYDFVINLSGNINHHNKSETYNVHYKGFKNIVYALKKNKIDWFIQIGSSLEYGKKNSPQSEKTVCDPISFYGKCKLLVSNYLLKKKIFNYIILRLYQVYGPNQKNNRLIPIVINNCLKNKKFKCTEGIQKRDFLFIDDFNRLILKILKKKQKKNGIYNVGFGKPIVLKNLITAIFKRIKKGYPEFGGINMRNDEILNLYPSISKVKKHFKWRPKTTLAKGLNQTIKFYKYSLNIN